ncbi:FAD-dependent thymidylate synthase [Micromonospora sp. CB01531]|nr:FAD-dependent thymidylate synthase [Micromonospora sp. CB01531]
MTYRTDLTVSLDDSMGSDAKVIRMAKASIKKTGAAMDQAAREGFINFLVRERHGVPFEHIAMTFYIEAPIMVWRQLVKHRHSSISEASGRYVELEPVFYSPSPARKLVQVGKPGAYVFEYGTVDQLADVEESVRSTAEHAWTEYQHLLKQGVAREIARSVLPVNIYTSGYVTINARSLMNLLSLRTAGRENATIVSHPQHEVELLAEGMERHFANLFPATYAAFEKHGRVAP